MLMKISNIKIPNKFKVSSPSQEKITRNAEKYKRNTLNTKKIIVNSSGYIIDGYTKLLGIMSVDPNAEVDVSFLSKTSTPRTYVYGRHIHQEQGNSKIYVWRMPNGIDYIPQPGEIVLANTQRGYVPIIVNRCEVSDTVPRDGYIKKIKAWGTLINESNSEE